MLHWIQPVENIIFSQKQQLQNISVYNISLQAEYLPFSADFLVYLITRTLESLKVTRYF